jgi:hypothetical protein
MRIWIIVAAVLIAAPALPQSSNHDPLMSGSDSLPPAAYSTPFAPLDKRMSPNYGPPPVYVPPRPSFEPPTAPDARDEEAGPQGDAPTAAQHKRERAATPLNQPRSAIGSHERTAE